MRGYDGSDREYTSGLCRDINDGSKQGAIYGVFRNYFGRENGEKNGRW